MRVPWTARRSNHSIPKETSPQYSLEGLMLKLKLQYFGHLMRRTDSLEKTSHLILSCPLLLLPPIPPSIRVFSNESTLLMRWPQYWSFSFSISPSNEHSGLVSFRIDWLDLLAVQGTCKSLVQHHSSKSSILCGSAFFKVQLSHLYVSTGQFIALTIQIFVSKVMSLLFDMLLGLLKLSFKGANIF